MGSRQSPAAYEDANDEEGDMWDHEAKQEDSSEPPSPSAANPEEIQSQKKPSGPMQKRRRVTRACDECRRKKIKCDGKQPCTHCTVYSYDCTYDQPSNRRRNPAPQYIEGLEGRVHRAEALLHMIIPNLDLNDPAIDIAVAQGFIPGLKNKMPDLVESRNQQRQQQQDPAIQSNARRDTNLESMVRAVGQIELDESGNWDYHGHSSGLSFMRRMREQLGDVMGPHTVASPFARTRTSPHPLESPRSNNYAESPLDSGNSTNSADLPPEDVARRLCQNSIAEVAVLLRTVHTPSYWKSFKRIYTIPPEQYADEDHKFLPLLYSTLAVGSVFGNENDTEYECAIDQGYKYFRTARGLLDIADCRDLPSIQTVIFMILFLQSSAKLSTCYAYVGVALRCALRLGLHRSLPKGFNPLEAEVRKRTFWTIRKMDIYVGAILGLPQTLSDEDVDQDYPTEVDDEYITDQGIQPMPEGSVSLLTAFNAHTRLTLILTKIVRNVYPIRPQNRRDDAEKSYNVPFSVVRDLEHSLETWKSSLPEGLSPTHNNSKLTRAQQMLRLAYAFAQALLYRPFLHFVGTDKRLSQVDSRAYTCAASYVNVARNIIHLSTQMQQKGLLNGAFWFIMYMTFFAIMSLVYFAVENPDNPTTEALMRDAIEGRAVLKSFTKRSLAADRVTVTLDAVFARLPEWLREGRPNPAPSRKRRQEPTNDTASMPSGSRKHIEIPNRDQQSRAGGFARPRVNLSRIEAPTLDGLPSVAGMPQQSGTYTPNSATFGQQAYSQMDNAPISTGMQQQQYPMSLVPSNPDLPDLSAMMFPSTEPFTYPNQPLTTFENYQFPNGESADSQLFSGTSYNQWQLPMENQRQQMSNQDGRQVPQSSLPAGMTWHGQPGVPQGQAFSDVNLSDIFGGGDWNNMMLDQTFRQ